MPIIRDDLEDRVATESKPRRHSVLGRQGRNTRTRKRLFRFIWIGVGLLIGLGILIAVIVSGSSAGTIQFGSDYKDAGHSFDIVNAKSMFTPHNALAFVASFNEGAGTEQMTVTISLRAKQGDRQVWSETWRVHHKDSNMFADRYSPSELRSMHVTAPGTYVLRFFRDAGKHTKLAQGTFTMVR